MNPLDAYMKNSVQTASPLQQVILLYEKAIVCLKAAKEDIKNGDIKSKIGNITKVSDIIRALDSSLDFKNGGEIATNLHALYDFIDRSLFEVHTKNDAQLIDDLIEILSNLKEGWEGIQSKV
ncbi:flagellar export chaperone FliS [Nitratiruptor sp. YY09-18]|uniref:flagellar export chaperone FliS n=1 Tax=Nitratiruptor sp. YY09-18 TaxID=2724901 RepID=UPI00191596A8|nr:flagellar export chaperone FliS [Nitratiruptor sp. YY09-18]BCD68364.1 flagellar protein FliS [Nitratiruptor sp. YY09-18]